ncbi:MAG: helix-turn-helix transcriptional regulator [Pseudomonadota bacterium]
MTTKKSPPSSPKASRAKPLPFKSSHGPEADAIDRRVGQQLRRLRNQASLTLAELADLAAVNAQQIQRYETGLTRPRARDLWFFAQVFKVPFSAFFAARPITTSDRSSSSKGSKRKKQKVVHDLGQMRGMLSPRAYSQIILSPEIVSLIDNFERIAPNERQELLSLVRGISGSLKLRRKKT